MKSSAVSRQGWAKGRWKRPLPWVLPQEEDAWTGSATYATKEVHSSWMGVHFEIFFHLGC